MHIEPSPNRTANLIVGVDVGGSKVIAGIFDGSGPVRRLHVSRRSTKPERGPAAVAARIARCVEDVVDEVDATLADVRAVGVGISGLVDAKGGRVRFSPRLGWTDVPLSEQLRSLLGLPVFVENECNLSTVGVYATELPDKPARMLAVFIGNSVGAGMMVGGSLCRGFSLAGGELGHMVVDPLGPPCRCGSRGCFEVLASRSSIYERIRAGIAAGRQTQLSEVPERGGSWRGKELRRAFQRGDPLVRESVSAAAHWIGVGIGTLARSVRPEVLVLGGSLMEGLGDSMIEAVVRSAADPATGQPLHGVRIMVSSLGDQACIQGAAWYASTLTQPTRDALEDRVYLFRDGAPWAQPE